MKSGKTGKSAAKAAERSSQTGRPVLEPATSLGSGKPKPTAETGKTGAGGAHHWTFLTNHSHVLVLLSRDPSLVLRQVALKVGITERAVQRIIADLESGGVIEREKVGRQNRYQIRSDQALRHPIEEHRTIGDLLELLNGKPG